MKRNTQFHITRCIATVMLMMAPVFAILLAQPASAQYWKWPWEEDRPRRQQPSAPLPTFPSPPQGNSENQPFDPQGRAPICLELEQRLASIANQGGHLRSQLPQIEDRIREARRQARRTELQLDRADCYEQFLFTRSLRRTRRCIKLDQTAREASKKLETLTIQRQQILGQDDRSYQDDIIRELASNDCGGIYNQEARRRNPFTNFWQDQDQDTDGRGFSGNTFAGLPFATYRTVCVRLCDGFYFPVSFSTLPTHFGRDADACQSRCAAPAELYFHQNPGQSVDQMVSHRTQKPYTKLKTAFKYRKEYVSGCSCKTTEYLPKGTSTAPYIKKTGTTNNGTLQKRTNPIGKVERRELSPIQ